MRALVDVLDWINLALFTLVAIAALVQWRAGRGRPALWAALAFAALALVVDVAEFLPEDPSTTAERVASKALVAVLVLFPYLLYRFTTAFEPPTRRLERVLGLMTIVLVVWTFATPEFPEEGESRPGWFVAYLLAFLAHWTILTVVVAVRLWRAGRGQPSVARRRMQLLSVASGALTVALLVGAASSEQGSGTEVAVAALATASALLFLLGLAPPVPVRTLWRRPEQDRLQRAVRHLMEATTEDEVMRDVLEPMARIVGARAVAVLDEGDRVVGTHGASTEMVADALAHGDDHEVVRLEMPSGSLLAWTSPYAPFFGSDELALLRTLGALTGLALDRARMFGHERAARLALERADEVKTNFVALAAHELRTPVATIDGIIQTLDRHGAQLPPEQRAVLEQTLRHQSNHMRLLVDQLLDLSRLDADAVRIEPKPLPVRERIEEVVATAAAGRSEDVTIDVDASLEAVADPNALERIVSNLVGNALRYGAPPIVVRAEQRDRHLRVSVRDHGAGVAPEFVPNLFERFTRSTRSRAAPGTGLGLAIARSYAHAHGGDLLYEQAEPHGARFELVLPTGNRSNGG